MSGLDGVPVEKIVGPVQWRHHKYYCECAFGAPEDPTAFMSPDCRDSYRFGVQEREDRIEALEEAIASARSQTFSEAAERIVTREPVDYWVEHLPVKLSTQQGMAGWLKSLAGAEVSE